MPNRHDPRKLKLSVRGCMLLLVPVMLLTFGLVAVPLVIVTRYHAARRQLEATGGCLGLETTSEPFNPLNSNDWTTPFTSVRSAAIGQAATRREFEIVARFENIETLSIHCRPNAEGLQTVAALPTLARINFEMHGNEIPSGDLKELRACQSLEALWLAGPGVNDDGLSGINSLPQLKGVVLEKTQVSAESLRRIGRLPNLDTLGIVECESITENDGKWLSAATKLEYLIVRHTPVGNAILKALGHSPIKELELTNTGCTNTSFQNLTSMPTLKKFVLRDESVGDEAVHHIAEWTNLEELVFRDCKNVTHAGVRKLQTDLPDCEIIVLAE